MVVTVPAGSDRRGGEPVGEAAFDKAFSPEFQAGTFQAQIHAAAVFGVKICDPWACGSPVKKVTAEPFPLVIIQIDHGKESEPNCGRLLSLFLDNNGTIVAHEHTG